MKALVNKAKTKRKNICLLTCFCCFICSLFFTSSSFADVSISGLDDIAITAWAGSSNALEGSDTYCVISCNGPCNRPRQFDVAAYTTGASDSSGNFYLTHSSNSSVLLRVSLEWSHPAVGAYEMSNYYSTGFTAPPSRPYAPGATSCADLNAQNTVTIRIAEGDLASAIAGTYTGTFMIDMCRLLNNGSTVECVSPVSFTVHLPELIQLTQLQNFNFNTWSGVGSVQGVNDFCVFRNGYGGFSMSVNGANDSGGEFHLNNGAGDLPYQIEFSDGGTWHSVNSGAPLSSAVTGFAGVSTRDCGGSTSHQMRVNIQQADLEAADIGAYSDTVTITIEPE